MMKDSDKLLVLAQTYSYLKGEFTSKELYNFILNHDFKFKHTPSVMRIGAVVARSKKFEVKRQKGNTRIYEAV